MVAFEELLRPTTLLDLIGPRAGRLFKLLGAQASNNNISNRDFYYEMLRSDCADMLEAVNDNAVILREAA